MTEKSPKKKPLLVDNPLIVPNSPISPSSNGRKGVYSRTIKRKISKDIAVATINPLGEGAAVYGIQMDWIIYYPTLKVRTYLQDIRGYTPSKATSLCARHPVSEWEKLKENTLNGMAAIVIESHLKQVVETQAQFLDITKIGMDRVYEMLTKLKVSEVPIFTLITDPADSTKQIKVRQTTLKSTDLANCMNALKTCMEIYRRTVGLDKDVEGMADSVEKIKQETFSGITQLDQNGLLPANKGQEKAASAGYDELYHLIEMRRDLDDDSEFLMAEGNRTTN